MGSDACKGHFLSCREVVDFSCDYLDGALDPREAERFKEHLGLCSECVRFFETYKRTPEVSREALATTMPANVKDAVRNYLRQRCGR